MRNLEEYPISVEEIVQTLRKQAAMLENIKPQRVGDMRPLLYRTAARIVERASYVTHDIGKGLS